MIRQNKFKKSLNFIERSQKCKDIMKKYPDRIPIILFRDTRSDLPEVDRNKYLVPRNITVGEFMYVIRKRISLPSEQAIYFFIDGSIPTTSNIISLLYEKYKDNDGFLYMSYTGESTFG